jgi:L-proline amide hydrolase
MPSADGRLAWAQGEATPELVGDVQQRIPGSRWELFEWSSHMPHIEEPAHFRDTVAVFLSEVD